MHLVSLVLLISRALLEGVVCQSVSGGTQPSTDAPNKNLWKALSQAEAASVTDLLQRKFNLSGDHGSSYDNYVYRVTLLRPNKTSDNVPYAQNGTNRNARYARASLWFGSGPYVQEYMVGPLPATNSTEIQLLTYPFNNRDLGKTHIHPIYSTNDSTEFLTKFATDVEDITKTLWNTTILEGGVGARIGVPFWNEDGHIISWAPFLGVPDSELGSPTILPRGVSAKFDLTARDWRDWKITGWTCNNKFYNSTEAFRAAISAPSFHKPPPNLDGQWASTDKHGDPLPLDDVPPPVSVAQGGARFKLDTTQDYVAWMDFSLYYSVSVDTGLALHDVHFKGKRIMYELSLQDAITHYAGSDPFASQAVFFDTVDGMGASLVGLVKGYDCPSYATYLNATFAAGNTTTTRQNVLCMFEMDAGYPLRRHSYYPSPSTVAKNVVFVMRTIATVGNYDFLIEYSFAYDGAVEVSSRASGYISAAYWDENPEYGFHVHDYLNGGLHDHILSFKADLDILGEANSVQKVEFEPESVAYPWSQGRVHNTMKAKRSFVNTEASINFAENDNALYAVVNRAAPNRLGEYPGYRFRRTSGTSHLTIKNSTDTRKTSAFTTHDFYLTRAKPSEPRAADSYNQYQTEDPLVDFSRFVDGESIEQQDIVLWFNLGMHHMPNTADLPNTMFSQTHSGMRFEPFNYLEGDPSVASSQQVRVQNGDGTK